MVLERIKYLRDELNKLGYNYYVLDNPLVSDYEYDNLFGWNGNINSIVYRRYCADRYYCDGIHWEEIDRSEIKFNEFGEVQNLTRHHLGKLINKTRNKYDKAGRLIVQESIDEPGRLFVAYNYKYDSSDKLIEKIIKNKKACFSNICILMTNTADSFRSLATV